MSENSKLLFKNSNLKGQRSPHDELFETVSLEDYNLVKNSKFFSSKYYLDNYKDVVDLGDDPVLHYIKVGYLQGYNPNSNFDNNRYIEANSDVKEANLNPLIHYLKWGQNERRSYYPVPNQLKTKIAGFKHNFLNKLPSNTGYLLVASKLNYKRFKQNKLEFETIKNSGLFDENFYENQYPEVEDFNHDLVLHYMFIGSKFNFRPTKYFDTNYYKNTYNFNGNPFYDYILDNSGKEISFLQNIKNKEAYDIIKNSEFFDLEFYLKNYPEVKDDPINHFIFIGAKKGYNPSEKFNTSWYLKNYPDSQTHVLNPLVHYLEIGKDKGYLPKPLAQDEASQIIDKIDREARNKELYDFNKDSPLVSIVILNRNGLNYLKVLFKDFKDTICYPNYEIIVVDNDSKDESLSYLKSLDLPIKIIENKTNESFSKANNKGVEIANGEYIVLLNNDMEPVYGWLNHMMQSYLKSPDIGIVGAKLIFPFREGDSTSLTTQNEGIKFMELNGFYDEEDGYVVPYNIKEGNVFKEDREREIGSVLGASLLIKKELYEKLGGLDDRFFYNYEDIDLCFKAIDEGYKVIYNPDAQLYHYYQATRKDAFDLSPNDLRNRFYLYRKWNKWISEKLFVDKLNNDRIFSNEPLRVSYISLKDLEEEINDVDFYFIKYNNFNDIQIKNNSDILISDIYDFNPEEAIINNMHQVKVAIVKNNVDRWLESKNLDKYDIILTDSKYFNKIREKYFLNTYLLSSEGIINQIKDILLAIYDESPADFNNVISNPNFEDSLAEAHTYEIIRKSEYFDEKWYLNHYDIEEDPWDAVGHYLHKGGFNQKNPGPNFNSKSYLNANPDVKMQPFNPLAHYELFGKAERRKTKLPLKDRLSYNLYKFLVHPKIFPLTKRLFPVKDENILFYSPWDNVIDGKLNENSQILFDEFGQDFNKFIFTKKSVALGEKLDLLKKVCKSKTIIIDSGFSLLADLDLDENQKVINIWHACGAFKKIAYDSPHYSFGTLNIMDKEFSRYSNFIVSSEDIVPIYAKAHGMKEEDVLPLGVPRTDLLFDEKFKEEQLTKLYSDYPNLKNKEILLYTPTFRDDYVFKSYIDWDTLSENLDDNEVFVIKRHPLMIEDFLKGKNYDNIMYIEDESLFSLMFASKMMVTDYSSTIFEYSLLNKPVIHYCPDFDQYLDLRGFYLDFNTDLYGEIIKNPAEFVNVITNKKYKLNNEKLEEFKVKFMSSCDGKASSRIIKLIKGKNNEI